MSTFEHSPESALLTDYYQLTMLHGYFELGMNETAVFELFVRALPARRNFLMAAGLEQFICFLEELRFSSDDLQWLAERCLFPEDFLNYVGNLRFTGDVNALPEGTIFFAEEPIVQITAPLPQAQMIETRLINLIHFQTLIASKAARSVLAAPGKLLVDFGLRRAHGAEAGLLAARASYLAGFSGTSTVLAGRNLGIPLYGTMAHSFVQAHDLEAEAFERFARTNPAGAVLLLDTYDTENAAAEVVNLAPRLKQEGIEIKGVRLDSGDLRIHALAVRNILDAGGLPGVRIFASGHLDEYELQQLLQAGAPIDGFGVGTKLDVSADAPYLDCAYKIQEYAGRARRKRSEGKSTWPGRKQVYRSYDRQGRIESDLVALASESPAGTPLLRAVLRAGRRLGPPVPLEESRKWAAAELQSLPEPLRQLDSAQPLAVKFSPALRDLAKRLDLA